MAETSAFGSLRTPTLHRSFIVQNLSARCSRDDDFSLSGLPSDTYRSRVRQEPFISTRNNFIPPKRSNLQLYCFVTGFRCGFLPVQNFLYLVSISPFITVTQLCPQHYQHIPPISYFLLSFFFFLNPSHSPNERACFTARRI